VEIIRAESGVADTLEHIITPKTPSATASAT
jgi:hypothetical protein